MKERGRKKEVEQRSVLVCNAKLVWTPSSSPNEHYILVTDTGRDGSYLTNRECASFEEIAEEILSLGADFKIVYEPGVPMEMLYVDGYFGRPLIPVEGYQLSKLNRRQVKELETHLSRLKQQQIRGVRI